jgi:hypothetical protein
LKGIIRKIDERKFLENKAYKKRDEHKVNDVYKRKTKDIVCFQKIPLLRTQRPGAKNEMQAQAKAEEENEITNQLPGFKYGR